MIEPPARRHRFLQGVLARVSKWRVADVVCEAERFGQVLVEAERAGDYPADLRDLYAVSEARTIMVSVGRDEYLGLGLEAAEGDRMDDPISVALEFAARTAGTLAVLGELAAAAGGRIGGVGS